MELSPQLATRFETLQNRYPFKRSALIPMLMYAQDEFGYITDDIIHEIARRLNLRPVQVNRHLLNSSTLKPEVLEGVDLVVVFEEDSADALIERLRPDVHAKGTDYTAQSVPERATVAAVGARVAIAGDPKSHSTKDLIATILTRFGQTPSR